MGEILFLAHRVPFPPNRGDKIRAHHLLKRLAQIAPVHVGCFAENAEDRTAVAEVDAIAASQCVVDRRKPLTLAGVEAVLTGKPVGLTAFHSARLESWIQQTLAKHPIDTIVIFSGQMGQYVPDSFAGRVVIDLCDVDSAKFEGYAEAGERVWLNTREGRLLAEEEERLGARANATILISEDEAELYRSRLKDSSRVTVQVIGNGIDAAAFDPRASEPHAELQARQGPHFVFTGQMDYRPNEQAAEWVIEHLLPVLRTKYPEAECHIVGRNPTARLLAHADTPGLTIWGEVPDVKPFIAAADFVLAPLLIARGVQNKVLEAMAMAKPVVLTQEAATGIAAHDGEHWLVAPADPKQMAARIETALSDPDALFDLGASARQFVLDRHAWNAMLEPLGNLISPASEARNAA